MKRKIFTFVIAIAMMAASLTPAAAAQADRTDWNRFCFRPVVSCPSTPDQDQTPDLPDQGENPDAPDQDETPDMPDRDDTSSGGSQDTAAMSQLELAACQLINEQRAANGLAPLTISSDLSVKARIKSRDMLENGYFDHNSPTYGSPFDLMKSLGITYRSAGENIAMGYRTAEAVVNAWMNSSGHRANILSTSYQSFGIGYVDGYWTQWFIG